MAPRSDPMEDDPGARRRLPDAHVPRAARVRPAEVPHGWKFIKIGPDGKLYVPIIARGVRNTVGFDFHPNTGELWFTDNQRDWLSEDLPNDELNHLTKVGQHFGYPYCHQDDFSDPELGGGKSRDDSPSATIRTSRAASRCRG